MSNSKSSLKLLEQSIAIKHMANELPADSPEAELALEGSRTLARLAAAKDKKSNAAAPVLEIHPDATSRELFVARQRQSVRRGKDVYIPSWAEVSAGLPDLFLRSALFSIRRTSELVENLEIGALQDVHINFTGRTLTHFDQRVFSVCLSAYQNKPLCPASEMESTTPVWCSTTFYKFAQALDSEPSDNLAGSIKASLLRLSAARLRIRTQGVDIPAPDLLRAAFVHAEEATRVRVGDEIKFCVPESISNYFGKDSWSCVPRLTMNTLTGLAASVDKFYSSHRDPQFVPVVTLRRLSGSSLKPGMFLEDLTAALESLKKSEEIDPDSRVVDYRFSPDKSNVFVKLACMTKRLGKGAEHGTK